MVRRKQRDSPACPRCGVPETAPHVWACQHHSAVAVWETSVSQLQRWMKDNEAYPPLQEYIFSSLMRWKKGSDLRAPTFPTDIPAFPSLQDAHKVQSALGWSSFLEGRLSIHFAETQQLWFRHLKTQYSGRRWVSQLILKLFGIAWDQWEHRNGIANKPLDSARHQHSTRLVLEMLALGPRSLTGPSLSSFQEGYKILRKPAVIQEAWLASIEAALARKQAELNKRRESSAAERRCMASWLQLGSHPA